MNALVKIARWLTAAALVVPMGAFAADPQIAAFTDNPDPVPAGGNYDYTVQVSNNDLQDAANVVVTVDVPAGATFVSASPPSANCVLLSATQVQCSLGSVLGNGADVRNVVMTWKALGPGPTSVSATATLTSTNDTNLTNNTQNQTTTVISGADLSLTKSGAPDPVAGGGNVTYSLTVSNAGPNASANIVVTDTLPPSVSYLGNGGSGWSCSAAGQVVTCTHAGSHPAGASLPVLTLVAKVNVGTGTITNSATVAPAVGGTIDPDTTNNTATANTTVVAGADVSIAQKTVTSASPAIAGQNTTFQIQPRNAGPSVGTSVTVTDVLPAGWTFVSAVGTNWTCGAVGQTVSCTRASMPVGATDNITVVATAPDNATVGQTGSSYTNTATISSVSTDPVAGNNSGSAGITVLPDGADLSITKSKTPNPVAQGSNLTSAINVRNNGPRVASGPLRVVEVLTGESYVSVSGTGWTCTPTGNVVVCDHANGSGLAVGASLPTLQIVTTATTNGVASNTACTGNSLPSGSGAATASPPVAGDPNTTNDCATATSNSTAVQPDLTISKTTSTSSGPDKVVTTGESYVLYTLVGSNLSAGGDAATGIVILDNVPAYVSGTTITTPITPVVSAGTATFSCSVSGAAVTCTQTGGALLPGQTVTVPIRVNRPMADGNFTNTAIITNSVEGDPVSSNNSASDVVQIDPVADIQMTAKTVTPNPVRAGENATYVLSYRNNGPSTALNVALSDTFTFPGGDTGVTVISIASSKGGSSCSIAAGAVLNPGSTSFNCTIGSMASGETQTVTLVVRPNFQAGNGVRTFTNVAAVTTSSIENPAGGDNGNNSQSASLTVNPASLDLLVNKTDEVDPVPYTAGATFSNYRVRVTSNGPSFATNAHITENMVPPAGKRIRFVCDVTGAGSSTCNASSLCSATNVTSGVGTALPAFTCSVPAGNATTGPAVGELASGQSKDIYLRFEMLDQPVSGGDVFSNTATVAANEPDNFAANDTVTEFTTVRQRIDLAVTKVTSAATVTINQPFNWTITVVNNGLGNSLQTDLTDTLPAEVQVTGPVTTDRGTCTLTGAALSCSLGLMNNGDTATIVIPARVTTFPSGGTLSNTATVDTDPLKIGGVDLITANNTSTVVMTVTRSSLAGTIFQDRDRAGVNAGTPQAAGTEPRISGVTVTLTGTDAYTNPISLTATTDSNGNYSFGTLPPSDGTGYTVTETQPAGFSNGPTDPPNAGGTAPSAGGTYARGGATGNSSYATVVLGGNVAAVNYNFPEVRQPSLSGIVYIDLNANGVFNAGTDTRVSGATVRLLDAGTLAVIATTTTNGTGAYTFSGLDPFITYSLEEPLPSVPAGLQNGPVNPGLINGAACGSGCTAQSDTPAAGTDRIVTIDLSAGTDGTLFNFGENQLAAVSGTVYIDRNRNNTIQAPPTDGRIAGVTVTLKQGASCAAGSTLQTTTTAADGSYSFAGVIVGGSYLVCETQPVGYGNGVENPGTGATTPAANTISIASLPVGGSTSNNFGERFGSLAGSVYQDISVATPANTDNGVRDGGETGIVNVPVTLTGRDINGVAVNLSTTTDASGNYLFDDLLQPDASGYTITEGAIPLASGTFVDGKDAAGTAGGSTAVNDVFGPIALGAGQQATGYNFGELIVAQISGTVYVDRNRNNTMEATPTDARLSGITVTLKQGASCAAGSTVQTTTTAADGSYSFSGVTAGETYLLCESQPAGYANGVENPGTGATTPAANTISITSLAAGGSSGNNFGERLGSLAGAVYQDFTAGVPANTNNGVRDGGETGIVNVPVTLTGHDFNGTVVNRSTTTDASGNYLFDDLLPSDGTGYTITEGAIPVVSGVFNDGKDTLGTAGGSAAVNDLFSAIVLTAGTQGTAYNFGELPIAPITGTVYIDRNTNNTLDATPTDGRIPGVTLNLVLGANCSGSVVGTTTTDASGNYSFSGISSGLTYTLCQAQPAGYADGGVNVGTNGSSAAVNSITITNLPATGSAGNNFGERLASLAGSVYRDFTAATPANTNNGVRDGGETGIVNVPVTLTGRDFNGVAVNLSTTTDASGNYSFTDLFPSDASGYTITEGVIPVASGTFNDGKDTLGTAGGSAAVNEVFSGVVLTAGTQATGYNFGELPAAPISGTVYLDRNTNNTLDATPTDGRLTGVTLNLVLGANCSGTVVATATTDASGNYNFPAASAGLTYTLCEVQPAGYADGGVNPGPSGSSGAVNSITITNLPTGGSAGNNFAERAGSIAGSVWLDANNDGVRQGTETGISGITVTLTGLDVTGASVSRTATTDASGNYSFTDLLAAGAGGYTVTEQLAQPVVATVTTLNGRTAAGTISGVGSGSATTVGTVPSAVTAIALPAGGASINNNFGEILPVAVSGRVFIDLNNNGVQDPPGDLPLPGVTIQITGTDDTGAAVSRTLTTIADGSYGVNDLRPGTYTITEPTQPAGTSNGLTVAGSTGGTVTAPATLPSAISGLVLTTPGTNSTANNFAEIANSSSISGRVWFDANNNNTLDASEAGIAGVTIELTGVDLAARAVSLTTTTDASGNFSFTNLAPGTYALREPNQPAGTINGVTLAGTVGGTASPFTTTPSTITNIVLAVGQSASANNFGEIAASSIAGRVYADNNNNGAVDSAETGLSGVTITLTGTDDLGAAVSLTTTTDASGNYSFLNLRPGTYTVTEPTQPAGTVNGITSAGTIAGASVGSTTAPSTVPSAISAIVLPLGGTSVANNFGEIGNSPDLLVSKTHSPSKLTVGHEVVATITVRNAGQVATVGTYTVNDRLPTGLTLAATPSGTGWSCVGAVGAASFSCTSSAVVAAGVTSASVITARINVGAAATAASPVSNAVLVEGGGEIEARGPSAAERAAFAGNVSALPVCDPAVLHNACRDPAVVQLPASLSGSVWYDVGNTPGLLDKADRVLAGWSVEVLDSTSGQVVGRATTGADGHYKVIDLIPGIPYDVRFRDPQSGVVFGYPVNGETAVGSSGATCDTANAALNGRASSCVGLGASPQLHVVLAPGQELVQQSLPIDPSGVVYDSRLRQPVPGAVVTLAPNGSCAGWNPATSIVGAGMGGYTINGSAVSMTVGNDGLYQFLFAPAAPATCNFALTVTPPAGYTFVSTVIPPSATPLVPSGGPGSTYLVQPQAGAPTGAVGTGTTYFLAVTSGSGGANIIHNHIPLDPAAPVGLSLSKSGDKAMAEVGDTVRYTVTVQLTSGPRPLQTTVVDRLPRGFTFIPGTAIVNGIPAADPTGGVGPTLAFNLGVMPVTNQFVVQYRVRVGVGAMQGDGVNRAQGHACGNLASCVSGANFTPQAGSVATNEGSHRVRVTGGVFTTDACVLGKVFVDCNNNHVQDAEELGIPGVRLVMSDGTTLISDSEGKYSVCGVTPMSHVLKVDGGTLPRGSRLTTSSNRNLGDANSLWLDLKNGELHRADFVEGSCSNTVLEQVKARRAQGEVRAPEAEKAGAPALRFDSKAHGKSTLTSPQEGTDGANQLAPKPRQPSVNGSGDEQNVPTPNLPMNRPPPSGRPSGTSPTGGSNANP